MISGDDFFNTLEKTTLNWDASKCFKTLKETTIDKINREGKSLETASKLKQVVFKMFKTTTVEKFYLAAHHFLPDIHI